MKTLAKTIEEVNKACGDGAVVDLENFSLACSPIPTGVFAFDCITGIGGLPLGRIVELFGPESSGKSTMLLHACIGCQTALKRPVLYVDHENCFDKGYAEKLGVDLSKEMFVVSQPSSLEEGIRIAEHFIKAESVGLVIFDSLAAMTPEAMIFDSRGNDREFGDKVPMGAQALAMSKALQRLAPMSKQADICICFINQTRIDLKAAQRGIHILTTPGGRALKFYASMRVEFKNAGKIKGKVLDTTTEELENEVVGVITEAKIIKNKVASPFRHCEFVMMEGRGIDRVATCVHLALKRGYIEQSRGWYTLPTIDGVECPKKQGLVAVIDFFREEVALLNKLEEAIKKTME